MHHKKKLLHTQSKFPDQLTFRRFPIGQLAHRIWSGVVSEVGSPEDRNQPRSPYYFDLVVVDLPPDRTKST